MLIFLPIILIVAALFRLYNNTSIALWHDEAFSALYLGYDWPEMIRRAALDVHPPLYYVVLRFWSYFAGESLFSLRLLSIVFGVLTAWAAYLFVKAAFSDKKLAMMASLLVAINPFQVQYALEARMYTLGTFLIVISSYFLVKALSIPQGKKYWLLYSFTAAAALYTHYYLVFSVAAQALFIVYSFLRTKKISILVNGALSYVLAFILYLPWLPTFLEQIKRVQENFWVPPIDRWSIPGTVWKMAFGGGGSGKPVMAIATLAAITIIIYYAKKVSSYQKWHVIFGVLVPILGAIFLSFSTNIYLDRYFVFASIFFMILVVSAFYQIPQKQWRALLILALIAGTVFAFFKNWQDLAISKKPGMAGAASFVNTNARAQDKIYVGSSFVYFTFKYYNRTPVKPLLYSTISYEQIPHFSGTAILDPEDLILDWQNAPKNSTVWLVWTTGFGGSKPEVPKNWQQTEERGFEDAPSFKGHIFVTKYITQ